MHIYIYIYIYKYIYIYVYIYIYSCTYTRWWHPPQVRALVAHGASLEARTLAGRTPLFSAVANGTSLIRNRPPLGPYSRPMPRALRWS